MMTIDEKIDVLQAYKNGKIIEEKYKYLGFDRFWKVQSEPSFNFAACDYRIKPDEGPRNTKYRPFKTSTEVMKAIKEHGDWIKLGPCYYKIVYVGPCGIRMCQGGVKTPVSDVFFDVLKNYSFIDGSPLGIEE